MSSRASGTGPGPSVEPATLEPSEFLDSDHVNVVRFADEHRGPSEDPRDQAVALYYAVRDGFFYSPWGVSTTRRDYRASAVLARQRRRGHCIDKATVLAACARHCKIPARLHFANVRNHIGTARLEEQLGSDVLVFHGYCELYLDTRWVAATPAFNAALCRRLGVAPLDFDGRESSIFQEYDHSAGRFMEYLHDYGAYTDIPFELMIAEWRRYYPRFAERGLWPHPGEAAEKP